VVHVVGHRERDLGLPGVPDEPGVAGHADHLAVAQRELVTEFSTGTVEASRLVSYDDREVPFDLAVIVPLHGGADYVGRSPGLGDELGFIPVDPHTLQAKVKPNVFALGDATDVPASKAGSVAHFEGEVLAGNVWRFLDGEPLAASFDGHTNCFSRPAEAGRCSSTSTTTPSRWPGISPARSASRCCGRPG
jgi:hypothetical protein